ncbi:MAG: hypothetical protein OK457_00135 [Thaumarchaeota archaeon]|nr:hypothetical protein [Nitrososphaerota archaeon]
MGELDYQQGLKDQKRIALLACNSLGATLVEFESGGQDAIIEIPNYERLVLRIRHRRQPWVVRSPFRYGLETYSGIQFNLSDFLVYKPPFLDIVEDCDSAIRWAFISPERYVTLSKQCSYDDRANIDGKYLPFVNIPHAWYEKGKITLDKLPVQ